MDADLLFKIANTSILPAWFLLLLLPRTRLTKVVVHSYLYPMALAIFYAVLIIPSFFLGGEGGMGSVAELQVGFQNDYIVVGAWIHYLVFDLFIGAWESRDAVRKGIPHWQLVPCLVLTLFAGPIGLMLYLIIRYIHTRRLTIA